MATDEMIEAVDTLLNQEEFDEGARAALVDLGPEAVDLLTHYAADGHPSENPLLRGRAVLVLGELDEEIALPALRAAADTDDADTRVRAMRTLGRLDTPAAASALADAVRREGISDVERTQGVRALARASSPEAHAALEDLDAEDLPAPVADEVTRALADTP